MPRRSRRVRHHLRRGLFAVFAAGISGAAGAAVVAAQAHASPVLTPGRLLLSESSYVAPSITPGVTQLPPGCLPANCVTATSGSSFPWAFNNDLVDGSFGVTSPVTLAELTPSGHQVGEIDVPSDDLVTSFSSKSELALSLSPAGGDVTFMGYRAGPAQLDVSNSNTPGIVDPTNPVPGAYYRVVAQLDAGGHFVFTETNAYSGNNGRAAVTDDENGADIVFTAGNAGNGSGAEPDGVLTGAGTQFITPSSLPERAQSPGQPTPLGSFNITELGLPADKFGKDNNFRAVAIHDNVVYLTKGSGGNGINTVYFVDTTGRACPTGVGLPVHGAALPTAPLHYDPAVLQSEGVKPNNICILRGFPTVLAKKAANFPFGLWFAGPDTLYVADEGSGDNTYSTATGLYTSATAAAQPQAGLEKWVFDRSAESWRLAYTLQAGLDLGVPYTIPGYPTGDNLATGLPFSPATDGLRALTGRVSRDGTVTLWAVTSTVSGSGDQGADPDKLVQITDALRDTSAPAPGERFHTLRTAALGQVLRGISFTPGTVANG